MSVGDKMRSRYVYVLFLSLIIFYPATVFSQISFLEHPIADLTQGIDGHRIACADINSDGATDLIQIDRNESDIFWWELMEDENWIQHTITTTASGPLHACGADFDLDGDIDIIIASTSDFNQISFWCQNEDSWTEFVIVTDFSAPTGIKAVDMDQDGDMDILSASYDSGSIKWWAYESDEIWVEHTVATGITTPFDPTASDIDNDGDMDVAVVTFFDNRLLWLEQGLMGSWIMHVIDNNVLTATEVEIVDVDNDGDMDILSTAPSGSYYAWWEQTNNGEWSQHNILEYVDSIIYLEAADIDDDGDIDFVSNYDNALYIFEQTDTGTWESSSLYTGFNYKPLIADIDFDTDLDIYVVGLDNGDMLWLEQEGTPERPSHFSLISPGNHDTVWVNEVVLRWQHSIDPENGENTNYDFWIGVSPDMNNNSIMGDSISADSMCLERLADNLTFYWTVRATDDNTSGRWADDTFIFYTYFPEPPVPFEILYPGDGAVFADEDSFPLTFYWIPAIDPDPNDFLTYTLEISTDENFTNPLQFEAGDDIQFTVESLPQDDYWWRVRATDSFGIVGYSYEVRTLLVTLDVNQDQNLIPERFSVSSAYPNPFNPSVTIDYSVPHEGIVSSSIFNIQGQTVYKNSMIKNAGYHKFTFDKSQAGSELVSGIYFIQLQYLEEVNMQKVILLR